ncbi:MAG: DUF1573 domain-containing protein [Saprospiraceae bacterium]|nr:DUF1573 domain-containing protein [Saprospiraceae bacterium]
MKNFKFLSFALFITFLGLNACKSDKTAASATDAMGATNATTTPADPNAAVPSTEASPAPTGPTTSVEYSEMVYDFGEIVEGEHVKYAFKFKNTGSEPLIVSDAKGSCGCTVPDWPREPIAPGASSEIKVEFDSKGKGSDDGQKQTKKVTVTANTNPPQTYLTITGVVKKDPKAPKTNPTNPTH